MAKIISDRIIRQSSIDDQLERIKMNIRDSYDYFLENYERYNMSRRFIFESSLTQQQLSLLQELGRPIIEINILEAYISRLRGEFFKQEPSLSVRPKDGSNVDPQVLKILEDHIRAIFFDANLDGMEYNVYTDVLSGGFSAFKIYTDYIHEMSFEQGIFMKRCHDPTLVGFDKTAILPHKGDGEFAFECFPMSKTKFTDEYGAAAASGISFTKSVEGFNWSYKTDSDDVILVCDYYEKKRTKQKIVNVLGFGVMPLKEYEEMRDTWDKNVQFPAVVGKPRSTDIIHINRTRLVEDQVLEYAETDYRHLPLIFVDGNSQMLRTSTFGSARQVTRDYTYHARGVQGLKNLAAISLANQLENLVQAKWIAAVESIPEQYRDAYTDPQKASTMLFHAYKDNDPAVPLPAPVPVQQQPAPPEIAQAFQLADSASQMVLGSFDAALGINNNQLSGVAIVEGATQSNATAMPYIVGYLQALNQAGVIFLDLIPKYYPVETERNIPVKNVGGKRGYVPINGMNKYKMNYQPETLEIKIEAGVNFEIQRARSYQMFVELAKDFPMFAQFMSQPQVMEAILDNIDIRGIDSMKQAIPAFLQQQQQAQQQQQQLNPMVLKQQELQLKAQTSQADNELEAARLNIEQERAADDRIMTLAKIGEMTDNATLKSNQIQAEQARTAVTLATQLADSKHSQAMDILNLHHTNEHRKADRQHGKAMDILNLHHTNEHKNKDREGKNGDRKE